MVELHRQNKVLGMRGRLLYRKISQQIQFSFWRRPHWPKMVMLACIGPEHMIWTWTWAYNMGVDGVGGLFAIYGQKSVVGEKYFQTFYHLHSAPPCSWQIHHQSIEILTRFDQQESHRELGPKGTKCHLILTSYISNQIQWQGRKEVIGYTSWYLKFSHAAKKSFFVSN